MSIIEKAVDKLAGQSTDQSPLEVARDSVLPDVSQSTPDVEPQVDSTVAQAQNPEIEERNTSTVSEPLSVDIDLESLELEGVLTQDAGRSRLAEEYRMIKRPIITIVMAPASAGKKRTANTEPPNIFSESQLIAPIKGGLLI